MIHVKNIAFVAYPVTDKQRATDFYEGLLGLKRTSTSENPDGFWFEYDLGPNTLCISNYWKPAASSEQPGPTVGLEVEDIDAAMATFKEQGIRIPMEPMDAPACRFALVLDPDGNSIFIHQFKAAAT